LGICGGYQLLGKSYEAADGQVLEGLDLLDLTTRKAKAASKRIIGNVRVYSEVFGDLLGFENHGGRTYLGEGLKPLGKVLRGGGNNGEDGLEGVFQNYGKGLILGTYFHGFIPKNIQVADYLIQKITGNSYTQALIQDSVIENLNTLNGINLAY
jgi:CobQ-like glutamine amidotransferase family enzyme